MLKGVLLYIITLYLLGKAIQMMYEAQYDEGYNRGYITGSAEGVDFYKRLMANDVHRQP